MIESLPWPALDRLFFFLRSDEGCMDLASLSNVSPTFHSRVHEFMKRDDNRPGLGHVGLQKAGDRLVVSISFFPANLPFHELSRLDRGRFERSVDFNWPTVRVTLSGPEDPMVEECVRLLSSPLEKQVFIGSFEDLLSSAHLSLCSTLLHASTIKDLLIYRSILDENTAPIINSIIDRVTDKLKIQLNTEPQLIDPAAFIERLASVAIPHIKLTDGRSTMPRPFTFFGLSRSFWKNFCNEKLSNGSFEWATIGSRGDRKITKAPIKVPNAALGWMEWEKAKKK